MKERNRSSDGLVEKMRNWRHSGTKKIHIKFIAIYCNFIKLFLKSSHEEN